MIMEYTTYRCKGYTYPGHLVISTLIVAPSAYTALEACKTHYADYPKIDPDQWVIKPLPAKTVRVAFAKDSKVKQPTKMVTTLLTEPRASRR